MSTLEAVAPTMLVTVSSPVGDGIVDEANLVERARVDTDAFAQLYRYYLPRVHAFAYRRTGSTQVAEDICSATFEAALRGLDSYKPGRRGFGPWLLGIAANQISDHFRRESRPSSGRGQLAHRALAPTTADTDADLALAVLGEQANLRQAMAYLSPRHQQAVALRYLSGLDTGEAAAALGLSKPALAVVVSRALKALRQALERIEREQP